MRRTRKRFILAALIPALILPTMQTTFAAKTGSICNKINARSWDGNKPIICKKNSKAKLIWTSLKITSNVSTSSNNSSQANESKEIARKNLNDISTFVNSIQAKQLDAFNAYQRYLCMGNLYASTAQIWKSTVDIYQNKIEQSITASEKIVASFNDLAPYAPKSKPLPAISSCSTPNPTATLSSRETIPPGQWLIGTNIDAGTYQTTTAGCIWYRQKGLGGTSQEIISSGVTPANGGYVEIGVTDLAFKTTCAWNKVTINSANGSGAGTSTLMPVIEKVVSGNKWIAFQVKNPSTVEIINHPSFTITSSDQNGKVLIEGRNDKFPLLVPNASIWMYLPFDSTLFNTSPVKVTLTREVPNSTSNLKRPLMSSEFPIATDVRIINGASTLINNLKFTLANRSTQLRLDGSSIFHYFCFNDSGTITYASQGLIGSALLPGGSTEITNLTPLLASQCKSISVTIGPVYS